MSSIETLLNTSLGLFAYSMIVIPFAVLLIGAILYYNKPTYRLPLGIILVAIGSLGLAIYLEVLYLILINDSSRQGFLIVLAMIVAEILTLFIGIKSLRNRIIPKTSFGA